MHVEIHTQLKQLSVDTVVRDTLMIKIQGNFTYMAGRGILEGFCKIKMSIYQNLLH